MVRNESGQVAVEYILITMIVVLVAVAIINQIKSGGYLPNLVDGPSERLQGMVESGSWKNSRDALQNHPALIKSKVASKID